MQTHICMQICIWPTKFYCVVCLDKRENVHSKRRNTVNALNLGLNKNHLSTIPLRLQNFIAGRVVHMILLKKWVKIYFHAKVENASFLAVGKIKVF